MHANVTRKNRQMSIEVAKNDFTRKMIDFDTLQKLPKNVRDLGKVAQSAINRPIWSHRMHH